MAKARYATSPRVIRLYIGYQRMARRGIPLKYPGHQGAKELDRPVRILIIEFKLSSQHRSSSEWWDTRLAHWQRSRTPRLT